MKKSIIFLIIQTIFIFQIVFSQTINISTKTGATSLKLSDIDNINFLLLSAGLNQTMNVYTKTGSASYKLPDVDSINFSSLSLADNQLINIFTKMSAKSFKLTDIDSINFITTFSLGGGTVTDIDGNLYHTVTIGTQTWMVENLTTTKYRDGSSIDNITDDTAWSNLKTGAFCNYKNDANNVANYGRLYNWYAVNDSRKLAPTGWHVASDTEWTTLTTYLGGEIGAGGKLKEAGTSHWYYPNRDATNVTGFTALPGGYRDFVGKFHYLVTYGFWWNSTEHYENSALYRSMYYVSGDVVRNHFDKTSGFSVRCIRDF